MTHRFQSRNSLEFFSFPLPDSGQEVSIYRLPHVLAEEMSPNAHAATCVFRPQDIDDVPCVWNLSPAFALTVGSGTPALPEAPVITHSPGTNQSVAKLRGLEIQLENIGTGMAGNALYFTASLGSGSNSSGVLRTYYPGEVSRFLITLTKSLTLTNISFTTTSLFDAEIRVLAIGDAP